MLIYAIEISQTASSGEWSFNTPKINSGLLKQIIVEAATDTTTFDFSLQDSKDLYAYRTETKATGKLREEIEIPLKYIYTVKVTSSSADELFKGRLMIQE